MIDKTISPMGSYASPMDTIPAKGCKPIQERQEVVDYFFREPETKELLDTQLEQIGDLERIIPR